MAGDPALTSTGVVLGSPAYMSPERARGRKPGPEADLWSLGATLYAAVEGRPPYDSDNALGTLTAVISDPVEPPTVGGPLGRGDPRPAAARTRPSGWTSRAPARCSSAPRPTGATRRPPPRPSPTTPWTGPAAPRRSTPPRPTLRRHAPAAPPRTTYRRDEPPADEPDRSSNGLLIAGLVVGLLLIGGLIALAVTQRPGDDDEQAGRRPEGLGEPRAPRRTRSPRRARTPRRPEQPAEGGRGAPAGFTTYEDESGFSVAVPEGWSAEQNSATAVDIKDPSGTRFLRIDQTDTPRTTRRPTGRHRRQPARATSRTTSASRSRTSSTTAGRPPTGSSRSATTPTCSTAASSRTRTRGTRSTCPRPRTSGARARRSSRPRPTRSSRPAADQRPQTDQSLPLLPPRQRPLHLAVGLPLGERLPLVVGLLAAAPARSRPWPCRP